jgi:hypothetical protein
MTKEEMDIVWEVEKTAAGLSALTDQQREKVFEQLRTRFCFACGRMYETEPARCQCENDD